MKQAILNRITQLQNERIKDKKNPCHVTLKEILKEVKNNINLLIESGQLKEGDTINDKYYNAIDPF